MKVLKLNKDIFSKEQLISAKKAYLPIAKIHITENNKYWLCYFSKCKYDIDTTIHEFDNYMINSMNL